MKKLYYLSLMAMFLTTMAKAQEWTVFELPATLDEVPAKIQQQFGCTYQELAEKQNITHLKITGMDFPYSYNSEGKAAMHQLAVKAEEIDLSEVVANPEQSFYTSYYEGLDPYYIVEYINTYNLDSLRRIVYPKTLHHLSGYSCQLEGCDNLTEVVWPDDIREIPFEMFRGCSSLKQMDIPATIRELPEKCFRDCKQLVSVTLHEGLQKIGSECFCYCNALTSISIPQTVTAIEGSTFYQCSQLTNVALPSRLTAISNSLFQYCNSLSSIQIPAGVTEIGSYAFSDCSALKQITLPAGVTSIGQSAFMRTSLEQFTMPDAVTSVEKYAFQECKQLKKVHLSRGLTTIPAQCFCDCQALEEVNIPQRVTRIEHDAFVRCYMLSAPQLPEGLTHLDDAVFWDTRFEYITLPLTLQFVGPQCFRYSRLRSIDVPASVVQISNGAFQNCDSLRHATLHEGLLYLLNSAFQDCALLEDVALPNSLRVLGEWVFHGNKSKKSYVQPPLVNVVPNHICCQCENLTSVTLHERVTRIDGNAFDGCKQLTHINLPEGLTTIGSWSFVNCPLKEINIPSSVRDIGNRAFNDGEYTRVVVPEGVERIGGRAFYSKNLRYVDFPSTIAQIGDWSFQGDGPACDSIVLRTPVPPRNWGGLYRNWLDGALYVPVASVEAYKRDPGFTGFSQILPLTGYTPQQVVVETTVSTDSVWFPVINNANLTVTHNPESSDSFHSGHLHVGSKVNWPVNHLRYDYQQPWQSYDWEDEQPTATLINEGTMTAQSMELNLRYVANQWLFFTPPCDMPASSLSISNPRCPFVLRTFDGAQRAAGNHGQVWQNVPADAMLQAGHGYIVQYGYEQRQTGYDTYTQVDKDVCLHFESNRADNALSLSGKAVAVPLTEYKGEFTHNEGWNLVGNPFMAYFDIQQIESDAPILVPNRWNFKTFTAYSPLDDDFVLKPLQGFLTQRSAAQGTVVFNPEGRQPDFPVHREATNNARSLRRQQLRQERVVYDALLQHRTEQQGDSLVGRTRIVVTPTATEDYDRGHDASFITMDDSATALYSRTAGLRYSLNELPPTATNVQVGMRLSEPGIYTLALNVRGDKSAALQHLWLKDQETGTETDLLSDNYTFTVKEPCTLNNRFLLVFSDGVTEVPSVVDMPQKNEQLYDLQGRPVSTPTKGLYIRNGKIYTY